LIPLLVLHTNKVAKEKEGTARARVRHFWKKE
jgi:hypothetical protein